MRYTLQWFPEEWPFFGHSSKIDVHIARAICLIAFEFGSDTKFSCGKLDGSLLSLLFNFGNKEWENDETII